MKRILIPASLALLLTACGPQPAEGELSVVSAADAVCRPTPNGRQATGCYLTLTASRDDRLVSVTSPVSGLAQVHEMKVESNMMMMRELTDGLPLPAGSAVALAPGGNHIMLMGVANPLVAGDTVPLTLTFANARPVEIVARVGQPALATSEHSGGH